MAKNDGAEAIMSLAEMKPILNLSKRQPVGCALALTKDKQGIILLDKKIQGRKLGALLKTAAAAAKVELDMGTLRFGHASIGEGDATIHFTVNKEAPSALRPKMLEHLKKAGFGKCDISVDATIDEEASASAAQDAAAPAQPPVAPTATGAAPAAAPGAASPNPASITATAPANASTDAAALTAHLTALVKRLTSQPKAPGTDAMATAARAAQAALKAGDLAVAAKETDTLERLLGAPSSAVSLGVAPSSANPAAATFAKAGATWTATRKHIEAEVAKLQAAVAQHYEGQPAAQAVPAAFKAKVGPVLGRLDHTLADKLATMSANTDAGTHAKLLADVEKSIQQYEAFLTSDPVLAQLDANPFVPLAIAATVTKTLATLRKVVGTPAATAH